MVEANTIRGCLQTFGMSDAVTRTFITGPTVGLSTALAFIEMNDDSLKEVMKQVAEASRDAAYGAAAPAAGQAPAFVPVANRPKPNVMTKNALVSFTFALKCLYQRGVAAGEAMVASINDQKAIPTRRASHLGSVTTSMSSFTPMI